MERGYLYVETRADYPDRVRILSSTLEPQPPYDQDGSRIVYIARFDDLDAARMHVHNALRHQLLDINYATYRATPAETVAAIEADSLRHHRVWIEPQLAAAQLEQIEARAGQMRYQWRRHERYWYMVGAAAILLLLLLNALVI